MNKEFIPYEEAKELKELGFNEHCLASYYHAGKRLDICEYIGHGEYSILAPLYQQAFRWFREKHNILGKVRNLNTHTIKHQYYAEIVEPITVSSYSIYDSYEEAELECLRKLIEIVKQNEE